MSDAIDLDGYLAFVRTVETGSITAAARSLGVTRPTLSRQIATLEESLGLALLHRTTRSVMPTPAGQRLYEEAAPHILALTGVERRLLDERDAVAGLLRVTAPPVLASDIGQLLIELRAAHPALRVELIADIRQIDLRAEGVEVAVRAGRVADPDLVQRRLGRSRVSGVASPGYCARADAPASLDELQRHRLLRGFAADGRPQRWWPLLDGGRIPVDGAFACNDQRTLLDAALAGGGVALLSAVSAAEPLADGRLVAVLPEVLGTWLDLHAVFTRRTLQPARVRVFVDALVAWAAGFGEP